MPKLAIAVLVIVLLGAGAYLYLTPKTPAPTEEDQEPQTPATKTYDASAYGFSFDYPSSYVILSEGEAGNSESAHRVAVLSETTEIPVNGEGPTAIVVQLFPKPAESTLLDWLTEEPATNFNLNPTGRTEGITVGGKPAIRYSWSGLYEADAVAFESSEDTYVVISATWIDQNDEIRTDFNDLLASLRFN